MRTSVSINQIGGDSLLLKDYGGTLGAHQQGRCMRCTYEQGGTIRVFELTGWFHYSCITSTLLYFKQPGVVASIGMTLHVTARHAVTAIIHEAAVPFVERFPPAQGLEQQYRLIVLCRVQLAFGPSIIVVGGVEGGRYVFLACIGILIPICCVAVLRSVATLIVG